MKILGLVKYSLDVAEVKVDPATHELRLGGAPRRFGELDKGVVEAAVRVKEASGAEVEVLCFGPEQARNTLRDLLGMGADEAVLVKDPYDGSADAAVAIRVLAEAIARRGPFDVILCGFASDDGYSYQTGPRLAERLKLPFVPYVSRLEVKGDRLVADCVVASGTQTVSVALPAIASIAEEAFPPRAVTLLQAMKAQKKPTAVWELSEDLGLPTDALETLAASRLVSERGVVVNRKRQILKNLPAVEMADRFIDLLVGEGVLVVGEGR